MALPTSRGPDPWRRMEEDPASGLLCPGTVSRVHGTEARGGFLPRRPTHARAPPRNHPLKGARTDQGEGRADRGHAVRCKMTPECSSVKVGTRPGVWGGWSSMGHSALVPSDKSQVTWTLLCVSEGRAQCRRDRHMLPGWRMKQNRPETQPACSWASVRALASRVPGGH